MFGASAQLVHSLMLGWRFLIQSIQIRSRGGGREERVKIESELEEVRLPLCARHPPDPVGRSGKWDPIRFAAGAAAASYLPRLSGLDGWIVGSMNATEWPWDQGNPDGTRSTCLSIFGSMRMELKFVDKSFSVCGVAKIYL